MDVKHVDGINKGKLLLYALSTCIWCKQTKVFLNNLGIGYDFIDVDVLPGKEREKTLTEIKRFNPQCSFPTLVVNGEKCVVGYNEAKIREVLGL
jgi:glutaredoxin